MHKLISQLKRLYFLPEQQGRWSLPTGAAPMQGVLTDDILTHCIKGQGKVTLDLLSPQGQVRTLVLGFEKSTDWEWVAALYQGILEDLELPAPAMAITGQSGHQIWFSLSSPVPAALGQAFLGALCHRYLAELPSSRYRLWPTADDVRLLEAVPAEHDTGGKWSAFITASMGAMFREEPGLEMAPNPERQADLLAPVVSMSPDDLSRAMDRLAAPGEPAPADVRPAFAPGTLQEMGRPDRDQHYTDPKSFLLAVMNDPGAAPELRVQAASALLPYF